jgi:alpha-tubulin suppressor-like RCC1 family protein
VLSGTFAAGTNHALSIHADGTLWATGGNNGGQLGDGTTTRRAAWGQVGTATNWVQVAAGNFFSLGLRTDGTLWAWGDNYYGQLGRATNSGTVVANAVPMQVAGTYRYIAAGWEHTLALRADGTLWAWGSNYHGELGNSTNVNTSAANPVPAQVPGTYTQVDAGTDCSLALRADGTLWSWGNNVMGQLGTNNNPGANTYNPVPTQVAGTYTQVTAGAFHCLALRPDGTLWAWGNNNFGSLGSTTNNGTNAANPVPTQVPGLYTSASAGFYHSLALRADGTLWAWGLNDAGQLAAAPGTGPTVPFAVPTQVPGTYVQVATGYHFSLALQANGSLLAWGDNGAGQLGYAANVGTINPNPVPTTTGTALPTRSTSSNSTTGYAIRGDGTLWAWGSNRYGLLGDGTTTDRPRPGRVGTDADWVQVVAGSSHVLALKANGTVWAWGRNHVHQVSPASAIALLVPTQLPGYTFARLAAGADFNLGLTATGALYAWGDNNHHQLGVGSTFSSLPTPTLVGGSVAFGSMAAGGEFALGLTGTGQVYGWGYNQLGQAGVPVGSGSNYDVLTPTLVAGLPALRQVAAGYVFGLGLAATGVAYSWGVNASGQLGVPTNSGTTAANPTPTAIGGLPPLRQLEGGSTHSLGLGASGAIYSWGYNEAGMLAQGTFTTGPNPVPTQEATGTTAWAQLGTGSSAIASLVRTASAQTFASAGANDYGQLGDGTTTNWPRFDRLSPLVSLQPLPVLGAAGSAAFGLAPNPTRGVATAVGLPATATLAVYDGLGRLVRTSAGPALDVAGLPTGIYLVCATVPGQPVRTARLAVE